MLGRCGVGGDDGVVLGRCGVGDDGGGRGDVGGDGNQYCCWWWFLLSYPPMLHDSHVLQYLAKAGIRPMGPRYPNA